MAFNLYIKQLNLYIQSEYILLKLKILIFSIFNTIIHIHLPAIINHTLISNSICFSYSWSQS